MYLLINAPDTCIWRLSPHFCVTLYHTDFFILLFILFISYKWYKHVLFARFLSCFEWKTVEDLGLIKITFRFLQTDFDRLSFICPWTLGIFTFCVAVPLSKVLMHFKRTWQIHLKTDWFCRFNHVSSSYSLLDIFPADAVWGASISPINTLRPEQNGRHFSDDIFKCIFLQEHIFILFEFHWNLFLKVQLTKG